MPKFPRKFNNFAGTIFGENYYRWIVNDELRRGRGYEPILVWQMGKVGSSTILASLKEFAGHAPLFHVHLMSDALLKKGELYQKSLLKGNRAYLFNVALKNALFKSMRSGQRWKIISLVREPVGRNLSSFFENLELYYHDAAHDPQQINTIPVGSMTSTFLEAFDHDRPLEWFDEEILGLLGVDVFSEGFAKENGYQIYKRENYDLLVFRMEDLDRVGKDVMAKYLGLPGFDLIQKNVGSEKQYADAYRKLRKQIILPDEYLDRCYKSKYFRNFYTELDSVKFRKKWCRNKADSLCS